MIKRKYLHKIVIALCLWLPLQAIAGQWLHCAKMASVLDKKENIIQPGIAIKHSCHDVASIDIQSVSDSSDQIQKKSCNHCQFVCQWQSAMLLTDLPVFEIQFITDYSRFNLPLPKQPSLEAPQHPPQFFII